MRFLLVLLMLVIFGCDSEQWIPGEVEGTDIECQFSNPPNQGQLECRYVDAGAE